MANITNEQGRSWLVQSYFVLATLMGLVLLVFGSVTLVQLGVKEMLGVKPYPFFNAPFPELQERFPGEKTIDTTQLTEEQKMRLDEWTAQYDKWKAEEAAFNSQDQERRREIATALAMIIVGIPVFGFHAPHVFRKKK